MKKTEQVVNILNDIDADLPLNNKSIKEILFLVWDNYNILSCNINIVTISDKDIKSMKNEYFNMDFYTDVISFLLEKTENFIEGEIYICPTIIEENAPNYDSSYKKEFSRIIIHGALHLLGYEDNTNELKQEMRDLENKFLKELKYDR